MAGRQPPPGRRLFPGDDLTQTVAVPPMSASQASATGSVGPSARIAAGIGSSCVEIEGTGTAVTDPGAALAWRISIRSRNCRARMWHPSIDRRRVCGGWRHGAMKNVLLDAGVIELPGDDAGAARRFGETARRGPLGPLIVR